MLMIRVPVDVSAKSGSSIATCPIAPEVLDGVPRLAISEVLMLAEDGGVETVLE